MKKKSSVPGVGKYSTSTELNQKKVIALPMNRAKKVSDIDEHALKEKKKSPHSNTYSPEKDKLLPRQRRGGPIDKDVKFSLIDTVIVKEKEMPGFYNINERQVSKSPS